ncbi:MAG TPA: DUF1684 domain-containing protein [Crocinitomicaceae bacterium]|nr:DUF1684 domain-containing protein [Crocinitomicaceae bacterium]
MKDITNCLLAIFVINFSFSQKTESEINSIRKEHLIELKNPEAEVLNEEEIAHFKGLDYYDFDPSFQLITSFKKSKGKKFEMPTSTERKPIYRRYGYVYFEIANQKCTLEVYQNMALKKEKEFKNYLFIPFRDKTSTITTYGGGRFLDAKKIKGKTMLLDFNLAYNPYCAYSYRYSCPIPPVVNTLNVEIEAGEKVPIGH